jgi:ferrous iron transport protein A
MPLGLVNSGGMAVIRDIRASGQVQQQLLEQGLMKGALLRIIQNDAGRPLIVALGNTRLAMGHGLALQILVEECG